MLYKIAHILRDRMPFLWTMIGWVNSILFGLRYGRYSKGIDEILKKYSEGSVAKGRRLRFKRLDTANIPALATMFAEQPEEAFDYFRPHDFDTKTLRHLSADKRVFWRLSSSPTLRPWVIFFSAVSSGESRSADI